jgi:hypothetical protein
MSKPTDRWPLWKIVVATLGCAAGGAVLLWLSSVVGRSEPDPTNDPLGRRSALTLSGFLMILGAGGAVLSLLGVVWLGRRIYEARTPAWKRPGRKRWR